MNQIFSTLNCNGRILDLSEPKIMGILNLTPDSFSDGGKYSEEGAALRQVERMIAEGVDIIDIGPQSTRPHSDFLSAETEIGRLGKTISNIKLLFPEVLISIDTFWSETVQFAAAEGADLVNDISAGQFDESMFRTVAECGLPYILMHGNSQYAEMHKKVLYDDILTAINRFFFEKITILRSLGVKDIVLDPGFGFGKTVEDQFALLDETKQIGLGGFPVLIGVSRKSFIYKTLGKDPHQIGTEVEEIHLKMLKKGAKILRVHDVAAAKKTLIQFANHG